MSPHIRRRKEMRIMKDDEREKERQNQKKREKRKKKKHFLTKAKKGKYILYI